MDPSVPVEALVYFRYALFGGLAYLALKRWSPGLAKAVLVLSVGLQALVIFLDILV